MPKGLGVRMHYPITQHLNHVVLRSLFYVLRIYTTVLHRYSKIYSYLL